MHIHLMHNPAKFHPDLIQNDGSLGFLKMVTQQQEQKQDE